MATSWYDRDVNDGRSETVVGDLSGRNKVISTAELGRGDRLLSAGKDPRSCMRRGRDLCTACRSVSIESASQRLERCLRYDDKISGAPNVKAGEILRRRFVGSSVEVSEAGNDSFPASLLWSDSLGRRAPVDFTERQ